MSRLCIFTLLSFLLHFSGAKEECGYTTLGSGGILKSPGYPQKYPDGITCSWNITTPPGTGVRLHFIDFHLEDSFSKIKCYDFLQIVDLKLNITSPRFCGKQSPFKIKYDSDSVQVLFSSDSARSAKGFMITWEADVVVACSRNKTMKKPCPSQMEKISAPPLKMWPPQYQALLTPVVTVSLVLGLVALMVVSLCCRMKDRHEAKQRHGEIILQLQTIRSLYTGNYGCLIKRQSSAYARLEGEGKDEDGQMTKSKENDMMNLDEMEDPYQALSEI